MAVTLFLRSNTHPRPRPTSSLPAIAGRGESARTGSVRPAPYSAGDRHPLASPCYSVATVDLDHDGDLDIAAAEADSARVLLLVNDGTGAMQPIGSLATSGPAYWVAAADFDRDGNADLAVALNTAPGVVAVYRGLGGASFAAPQQYAVGNFPDYVVAGDLDGDQQPDLVVANYGDQTVSVLRNQNGAFGTPTTYPASNPASVALVDFDGDKDRDLAIVDVGWPSVITTYRNLGGGAFGDSAGVTLAGQAIGIAAADLDRDGRADLAVTGQDSLRLLWGDGVGGFVTITSLPLRLATYSSSVAIGDFDGDGEPDLAAAHHGGFNSSWISVFTGHGDRTFDPPALVFTGGTGAPAAGTECVAIADLDGVNGPDLVAANIGVDEIRVIRHARGRWFEAAMDYVVGPEVLGVQAVDFDAKGRDDLLVTQTSRVAIMRSFTDGSFEPAADFAIPIAGVGLDLDGNRRTDMLRCRHGAPDTLRIQLTLPGPTFGPVEEHAGVSLLAFADFNRDSFPDLAVIDATNATAVLLNDGTGHYGAPQPTGVHVVATNPAKLRYATGDFDGDGLDDLAIGKPAGGAGSVDSVLIALRHDDGTFTLVTAFAVGACSPGPACPRITQVAAADLDRDGRDDLAVMRGLPDQGATIQVLRNQGGATFTSVADYATPTEDPVLFVLDCDRDGYPDLVVETPNDDVGMSTFQLRLNRGDGHFDDPANIEAGMHEYEIGLTAGDFDQDGRLDVATCYRGDFYDAGGVSVLLNRATTNTVAVLPATRRDARGVALAIAGAWPNPTAGPLTVALDLASSAPAMLDLVDVTGRRVGALALDRAEAGRIERRFPTPAPINPGVYWLRLRQGALRAERKVTVVR